jgi:phage baseplate assembly protein W|tara:strand:+ start:1226 stop:1606 length:381 start_codon:yes stop_codon:yes gene_type:complete
MNIFADFNTSLVTHPIKKDLSLKTDVKAVTQSLKNLLLTDKGERLFQPNVGTNIRQLLFENFTPQTTTLLKQFIAETIDNHEPRANLLDVTVSPDPDNNSLLVSLIVEVINNQDPVTLNLVLERIR